MKAHGTEAMGGKTVEDILEASFYENVKNFFLAPKSLAGPLVQMSDFPEGEYGNRCTGQFHFPRTVELHPYWFLLVKQHRSSQHPPWLRMVFNHRRCRSVLPWSCLHHACMLTCPSIYIAHRGGAGRAGGEERRGTGGVGGQVRGLFGGARR